jgi:hypothetical protein
LGEWPSYYLKGLEKLKGYRNYERFYKRLGVLQNQAGTSHRCVELKLPKQKERIEAGEFSYRLNKQKYRDMIYRDGKYFLRTNQQGKDGKTLWNEYMLQCNVEQSFRELKSDLGIRPVYHHKQDRVEAHIFVAFMSYCLQVTLRHKLRVSACGLTSQAALETMSRIQILDVSFETKDNRILFLTSAVNLCKSLLYKSSLFLIGTTFALFAKNQQSFNQLRQAYMALY